MKGLGDIMKMAQNMQAKMETVQQELAVVRVEGTAGGGMVRVVANGKQEIMEVKIDPEVFNANDREMLEDMILAASNQAHQRAQELAAEKMAQLTGGIKIPGLF